MELIQVNVQEVGKIGFQFEFPNTEYQTSPSFFSFFFFFLS